VKLLVDARTGWGHGIGRVIANTVPRVARLRPDWRIEALVPPEQIEAAQVAFADVPNLAIVPCEVAPFSLAEQTGLQRYARGHDLTWFTNYWVPLAWRAPFVATVHDVLHLLPEFIPASPLKRQLAHQTFAKVRRQARAVMFVSRFTEREFARLVGEPRHRGTAVTLGGDHLNFGHPRPMGERSRRLIVVAASKQHKNFATLFAAWRQAEVPAHWTLTVISPRELLLNSVDLTTLARGNDRIDIRRSVSNDELATLYADSAIVLMPSLYEGFGLPLLEGLLAGALCVSSNAGSLVEVAQGAFVQFVNGTDMAGWTAAIEQACAIADRNEPDLDPLLRHNVTCAQRFRWDDTAAKIAAVLEAAAV
jgi:glycosyltransferase involved in cell wall biosynthesis